MKSTLFLLGAALLAAPAWAQKVPAARVPAAANTTFEAMFALAKSASWKKEGANYEASFRQGGKEMSAVITPAGKLLETETELTVAELPAAVRTALARDYKTARVGGAARIVRADGSTVYEAESARAASSRTCCSQPTGG